MSIKLVVKMFLQFFNKQQFTKIGCYGWYWLLYPNTKPSNEKEMIWCVVDAVLWCEYKSRTFSSKQKELEYHCCECKFCTIYAFELRPIHNIVVIYYGHIIFFILMFHIRCYSKYCFFGCVFSSLVKRMGILLKI